MWALSSNGAADSIPYCLLEATDLQIKNTFAASSENVTKWIKLIYRGRQMIDSDGFRPNVGIILSRDDGRVFWARRVGQDAWQFPQGGINKDETPEQAMIRELQEETGLLSKHVEIMGQSADWLRYRLPKRYIRKREKPLCIGQKQIWFLLRFIGEEADFKIDCSGNPEFDCWRWVDYWYPLDEVIYFKRSVYQKALRELSPILFPDNAPPEPLI